MAEFEEKLNAILSDPKAMGQIMSIARALGGDGGGGGGTGGAPAPDAGQDAAWEALPSAQPQNQAGGEGPPLSALGDLDPKLVQTALRLFSEYNAGDNHKTALLAALQPFLKEERYAKVDKAVQIAKLSRVVRVAFQMLKGGEKDL